MDNVILLFMRLLKKIRSLFHKKNHNSDKEYLIDYGKIHLGYKMNLDCPKTFNEKLNWYKLNYRNDLMPLCADKYEVRNYIKSKGLTGILLKNYGVFDSVEEINLDDLPDQFVIKVTGDSGGVAICKNKEDFSKIDFRKFSNLNADYSELKKEWHYHYIKNRVIVEELINTKNGKAPNDYKFFCFYGEPKFLFVASDRDSHCKFDFFDMNWNHINVIQGHPNNKKRIAKPEKFDEMIEICRILSKDFPHVRVDLYYENGNIYFGELTFFHFAGFMPFYPKKYDRLFGEYFNIDLIL